MRTALEQLLEVTGAAGTAPGAGVDRYREALARIERTLPVAQFDDAVLALYQQAYRELERQIAEGDDRRHRFVVIIPVADRPQHLRNILGSLLELCRTYHYGGVDGGRFRKVAVVVADDSREPAIIEQNRAIAAGFTAEGLDTRYFGAEEQAAELAALAPERRRAIDGIVGTPEHDGFQRKGASITRNIAYLMANRMDGEGGAPLFVFVDSDEQFKVRVDGPAGGRDVVAVNYFHHLDRIFDRGDVRVLTGKVVGDPPVSPAVMAANFLEDVIGFLGQIAASGPEADCGFHGADGRGGGDAAYHDLADLFGFAPAAEPYRYRCTLQGGHDHVACLRAFAGRLDHFFDGEHPTRITYFEDGDFAAVKPARTVYTGNYVCNLEGLVHFIPFAPLKLRMAGPALGRLIRAEIGERFVTANLPLLHTRTVDGPERFEYRPGVARESAAVDLSGEFERQFFGDVMLFTIEALTGEGYPAKVPDEGAIEAALASVESTLHGKYLRKRSEIGERLARAKALFDDPAQWWNRHPGCEAVRSDFHRFFANLENNFSDGSACYRAIQPGENRERRHRRIRDAILRYAGDRDAWLAALGREA